MSLVKEKYVWGPVAADYYGKSLRLLMQELDRVDANQDTVLAATMILL